MAVFWFVVFFFWSIPVGSGFVLCFLFAAWLCLFVVDACCRCGGGRWTVGCEDLTCSTWGLFLILVVRFNWMLVLLFVVTFKT